MYRLAPQQAVPWRLSQHQVQQLHHKRGARPELRSSGHMGMYTISHNEIWHGYQQVLCALIATSF